MWDDYIGFFLLQWIKWKKKNKRASLANSWFNLTRFIILNCTFLQPTRLFENTNRTNRIQNMLSVAHIEWRKGKKMKGEENWIKLMLLLGSHPAYQIFQLINLIIIIARLLLGEAEMPPIKGQLKYGINSKHHLYSLSHYLAQKKTPNKPELSKKRKNNTNNSQ